MANIEDLQLLLRFPSEKLSVEYNSWQDITDNAGKATLAKAAIALANEGGGIIVLGMRENAVRGGALGSHPPPAGLAPYSQDNINAAIERFADPAFHCDLMFAEHPATRTRHAFVIVPGGMTVPVMSTRGVEGVIQPQRCYVRKPGPRSEEPFTAEEWRGVLERCLQARRESMLDAIRVIVQGHAALPPIPDLEDRLAAFVEASEARWSNLIRNLPQDDIARMPFGGLSICISNFRCATRSIIKRTASAHGGRIACQTHGLGTLCVDYPRRYGSASSRGYLEVWLGEPVDRPFRGSAHCDFWRVSPDGELFLQRGYDEDEQTKPGPGRGEGHLETKFKPPI